MWNDLLQLNLSQKPLNSQIYDTLLSHDSSTIIKIKEALVGSWASPLLRIGGTLLFITFTGAQCAPVLLSLSLKYCSGFNLRTLDYHVYFLRLQIAVINVRDHLMTLLICFIPALVWLTFGTIMVIPCRRYSRSLITVSSLFFDFNFILPVYICTLFVFVPLLDM